MSWVGAARVLSLESDSPQGRLRGILAALLTALLAFAARIAVQSLSGFYESPETYEEGIIALSLAGGGEYAFELNGTEALGYQSPAYSYLLAGLYTVFGTDPHVAGILQAALGATLALLIWRVGLSLGLGHNRSLLAAVLVGLHPGLVVYSTKIHQLNLHAPLFAAGVLLVLRRQWTQSSLEAAMLGIVAGLSLLSRPTFVPAIGMGALTRWRDLGNVRAVLVATIFLAAVVTPWIARNAVVIGEPALTTTTGYLLWVGNNPAATGSSVTADGRPMIETDPALREQIWALDERDQDRIFRERVTDFVLSEPEAAGRLFVSKLVSFWWVGPTAGTNYPSAWKDAYAWLYAALLVTFVIGSIRMLAGRHTRSSTAAILVMMIAVSVIQAVFYVDGRHRWAVEPIMLLLAAALPLPEWPVARRVMRKARPEITETGPGRELTPPA